MDLGYNFRKKGKTRQNIEFVMTEAPTLDRLLQRIGRGGRVLGKSELDHLTEILIFVNSDIYKKMEIVLTKKEYERKEFAELLRFENIPPLRADFTGYLQVNALVEAMHPLYHLYNNGTSQVQVYIKKVFEHFSEMLKAKELSFEGLLKRWGRYHYLEKFSEDYQITSRDIKEYLQKRYGKEALAIGEEKIEKQMEEHDFVEKIKECIYQEYYELRGLLSFRESFVGPEVIVYDPNHLFSDKDLAIYDLFHILRNYQVRDGIPKEMEDRLSKKVQLYYTLLDFRKDKLKIELQLNTPFRLDHNDFEKMYCNKPVALRGFKIAGIGLPVAATSVIEDQYIPILICTNYRFKKKASKYKIYPINLRVFVKTREIEYEAYVGTNAYFLFEEVIRRKK